MGSWGSRKPWPSRRRCRCAPSLCSAPRWPRWWPSWPRRRAVSPSKSLPTRCVCLGLLSPFLLPPTLACVCALLPPVLASADMRSRSRPRALAAALVPGRDGGRQNLPESTLSLPSHACACALPEDQAALPLQTGHLCRPFSEPGLGTSKTAPPGAVLDVGARGVAHITPLVAHTIPICGGAGGWGLSWTSAPGAWRTHAPRGAHTPEVAHTRPWRQGPHRASCRTRWSRCECS